MTAEPTASAAAQCLRDAQSRLPSFIDAVLDRGSRHLAFRGVLFADRTQAAAVREAGAMLYKLRRSLAPAFLREASRALAGEMDRVAPAASGPLDICLDEGLAERLDTAHLHDAAELACTAERVEFDALFHGASGSFVVRGGHALAPHALAHSLASALREWPVRRALRDAWFTHLGEPLGMELAIFYRALSRGLRRAGACEAQFIPPVVGGRPFESWSAAA